MIFSIIISLLLTLIIEVTITVLSKEKENIKEIIIINCITNPIVVCVTNFFYYRYSNELITKSVLYFLEITVIFVEGFLFNRYTKKMKHNPYKFSLLLNGASFFIGEVINYILIFS